MALPNLVDGQLPLGRWPATVSEVEATFVTGLHPTRQKIWHDWLHLNTAMQQAVIHVAGAWLGGSFLTDKTEPGDIDCLYIVEWPILWAARRDTQRAQFLEVVAKAGAKTVFQLDVDSFILEWAPTSGVSRASHKRMYLEDRGYWDELWSRHRSTVPRDDALPRRGYVEVIFDGYV
jgi:hypothetical protein